MIAVNVVGMFHRNRTIPDALLGQHAVNIDMRTRNVTPTRHKNGLWLGPNGPRSKRVSGVLFLEHLGPWSVAACIPELWHNPWANKSLDSSRSLVNQYVPDIASGKMKNVEAGTGASLFDLDLARPGDD